MVPEQYYGSTKQWSSGMHPMLEPKAVAAQNPLIGGLMMRCLKNGG